MPPMMILRSSPPSPFGRKVKIALHHLGLAERVEVVATDTASETDTVERALTSLEASPPGASVDVGTITLACALGYQDLRFGGTWRDTYPRLVGWLDAFAAAVPAFEKTRITA